MTTETQNPLATVDDAQAPPRLRIALVAPDFPPEIGGMQTCAVEMAAELARSGHEVTVFAKDEAVLPAGLNVRLVRGLKHRRRLDLPLFGRHQVDVWHVMNAGYAWLAQYQSPVFAFVNGNDFLMPWVMSERLDVRERLRLPFGSRFDNFIGERLTARSLRLGFARVRHTFAISRYTEAVFLDLYPECRGRTSIIRLGVSTRFEALRPSAPNASTPPRLITVCRLADPRKNVDVVLRALAALRPQFDFTYTVVGDGPLRLELEALTQTLGLADRVQFVGRVADPEVVARMAESDLFILASSASETSIEGFGIVYVEANACGVPVLAARCGGAVDAVEEGVSGFFVERAEPEAVAAALAQYFRGETSFSAGNCRKHAGRFTWAGACQLITQKYTLQLAERSLPARGRDCGQAYVSE